jgi:menaquinone-dependent protoporphyrinogen oxidase
MRLLVAFATTDGMTGLIAERISERIRLLGHSADLVNCRTLPSDFDPSRYDGFILGGSVHVGGYQHSLKRFISRYRENIVSKPNLFFSVCMAIASKNESEHVEAKRTAERFPRMLGWIPDRVEVFAGALMFSRYGMFRKPVMRAIAKKEMGEELDPSRDYIFTDWEAVDALVPRFLKRSAAPERPVPSSAPTHLPPAGLSPV